MTKKAELLKKVNELIAEKKSRFSNMDIESPMSDEEKELTKQIAGLWSEINQIVRNAK